MDNNTIIDSETDEIDLSEIALAEPVTKKRKKRASSIAPNYDPSPEIKGLKDGYSRPMGRCWVDTSVATPISLSELSPLWRQDISTMGEGDRKARFLATRVVRVNNEFRVKSKSTNRWRTVKSRSDVINILMNEWGQSETMFNIRRGTITDFLDNHELCVLDETLFVPGAGDFVEMGGRTFLNTYYEPVMPFPLTDGISSELGQLIELIQLNLLGNTHGGFVEAIEEILGNESTPLKWVMHWLASQYQRPGKHLPTALWFVGKAQGIGKGQFSQGMELLLGRSNVKNVSAEEFKSDWTDFVDGAHFFLLDEVDFGSRQAVMDKSKRLIGNATIAVRKRHLGDYTIPSVGNFLFTTNNVYPIAVVEGDRRHTFFETKNSKDAKKRARDFYNLGEVRKLKAWEGMAELLNSIDIDDDLISIAYHTDVKQRMIDGNVDPVEEWFFSEGLIDYWPVHTFADLNRLQGMYFEWAEKAQVFSGCRTTSYFKRELGKFISTGHLSEKTRRRLDDGTRPHGYVRFDPDLNHEELPFSEYPCVPDVEKNRTAKAKMQHRRQKTKLKVVSKS